MKIAFINSTFEAGKDGPGDYTRLLAGELARRGWECGLFSYADRITESHRQEMQEGIPTFRFSKGLTWEERFRALRSALDQFSPDVMSLGVVCYAMHPKGFAGSLARRFSELNTRGVPWHLMYQEIWIGAHLKAPYKDRLVGWIQRRGLMKFAHELKPKWIDCWNPVHQACLKKAGVHSAILPVMSTIPMAESNIFLEEWKTIQTLAGENGERSDYLLIGFFGTLHPQWPSEPLFSRIDRLANKLGKKVIWIALGDLRSGKEYWDRLQNENKHRFKMIKRGELSFERLSLAILELDYGVATTPWQILGKSSTASAFLEHGIPLLVNREEPYGFCEEIEDFHHPLAVRMDDFFEERFLKVGKQKAKSKLPEVADIFISRLS